MCGTYEPLGMSDETPYVRWSAFDIGMCLLRFWPAVGSRLFALMIAGVGTATSLSFGNDSSRHIGENAENDKRKRNDVTTYGETTRLDLLIGDRANTLTIAALRWLTCGWQKWLNFRG